MYMSFQASIFNILRLGYNLHCHLHVSRDIALVFRPADFAYGFLFAATLALRQLILLSQDFH